MSELHTLAVIATAALVTALIRFLPFVALKNRPTPAVVSYLGQVLPYAIMAMLVVYCLKDADPLGPNHALPELVAVAVTAGLHVWKRSTLLSIVGGTACYMLLLRAVALL